MIIERSRRASTLLFIAARSLIVDQQVGELASERLMATHARSFHFAARFLPVTYRESARDLYAFFRTLDDFVDESDPLVVSRMTIEAELDKWDCWFGSGLNGYAPDHLIGDPLAKVVARHRIPPHIFREFIAGLRADLTGVTITNRQELESYCYQVASTVGIAMSYVMGATDNVAHRSAIQLGIAMQLTNILRDIGGDLSKGRVYLPRDLLNAHALDAAALFQMWADGEGPDDRLRSVISEMISWADEYYQLGNQGIRYLPEDAQLPILLASRIYQEILRQIERNGYDSLRSRAMTSTFHKSVAVGRCALELTRGAPGSFADELTVNSTINVEERTSQ